MATAPEHNNRYDESCGGSQSFAWVVNGLIFTAIGWPCLSLLEEKFKDDVTVSDF